MIALDSAQLVQMSQAQLDELFRNNLAGPIPQGEGQGTAIIVPGTPLAEILARLIHLLAWKGKVFDPATGTLRNLVLPFGLKAVTAKVYQDKSWFEQKECIVLDYSKTSLLAHWVRDEIREVSPGLYLGVVFWSKTKLINFALVFSK